MLNDLQDAIVCEDVDTCKNYSKLEWSFSQSKAQETLSSWNRKQSSAMALSAGEIPPISLWSQQFA